MTKRVKNLLICVIISIIVTSNLTACVKKPDTSVTITTQKQVHEITYSYVDCGDLKLKNICIQQESTKHHAGSLENQQILTKNLILLDYKLREAESLLECYKNQVKKNQEEEK